MKEINQDQKQMCEKFDVKGLPSPPNTKVGIALNVKEKELFPINGLRHNPQGDTSGWYIWAGKEFSHNEDFFVPLHIEHLSEWRPEILKYLALPPGFRFLIGENNYEDVWFDESLIDIDEG